MGPRPWRATRPEGRHRLLTMAHRDAQSPGPMHRPNLLTPIAVTLCLMSGCDSGKPPEPESRKPVEPATTEQAKTEPAAAQREPKPATAPKAKTVQATAGDPVEGKFTMEDATKGLEGDGALVADLVTDEGTLTCELWPDKAPITVANFVGLARGLRPWKDGGEWVKKPLYDGTPFHRVIKGFMIQGGDPNGNGSGGPGYVIPDEIWEGAAHDERGLLCMANRGPNTNGSQFFILDKAARHLDNSYTIFGKCGPDAVIEKLAATKTRGDRAVDPPKLQKVTVKRVKK